MVNNGSGIDMRVMQRQRLKSWIDIQILGGDMCPGRAGNRTKQCPLFTNCGGDLPEVSYCKLNKVQDQSQRLFREPKSISGKSRYNPPLVYERAELLYDGAVVIIHNSSFVNYNGHAFTSSVQYLHGGCQDIVDDAHGGYRLYNASQRIISLKQAVNLVHLYGANYYHFLIEVLPRVLMVRDIIMKSPELPLLFRVGSPVHLLRLIGLDHTALNIIYVSIDDLFYIDKFQVIPLAPRCLHAPSPLMKYYQSHLWKHIDINQEQSVDASVEVTFNIVYFSRLNVERRYLIQERQLLDELLHQLGAENVSSQTRLTVLYGNETLTETVHYVSTANMIVGSHGAALSNIIFMKPKKRYLVEIASQGYYNPCFMYLSNSLGINHNMIRANGTRDEQISIDNVHQLVYFVVSTVKSNLMDTLAIDNK
ncbi:hypothetical protein MP228_003672 [Amoeboaphelidium protococcarum]|nr:hypothetical protein MP228_003672 [Amoeboaphelidium protococcarum]